jgi:lipopolysaccharide transport system permease protein
MINDSDPQLTHPGRFVRRAAADIRIAAALARRLTGPTLRSRHRASVLGYLWLLASPLSVAAVWIFLHRSRVAYFGATELPYPVYVIVGVLLWTAFLKMLNSPLQQLQGSRHMLTKISFPWEALVFTGWAEALIEAGVFLIVIAGVDAAYGVSLVKLIASLPFVFMLLCLGAGLGLFIAPFGLLYDDIPRAVSVATYLLFFLTPIIYPPPTSMPGVAAVVANPIAILLVTAREIMASQPLSHPLAVAMAAVGSGLILLLGLVTLRVSVPHVISKL